MKESLLPVISFILPVTELDVNNYFDVFFLSIHDLDYPKDKIEIILRDNGLKKETRRSLIQRDSKISVCGSGKNIFYARGVNQAVGKARGEWLYIGNADTVLERESIKELVKVGEDERVVIVGPRVFDLEQKDKISKRDLPVEHFNERTGRLLNVSIERMSRLQDDIDVVWVSGCGMLVRRSAWRELAGFDERYYIYWEDADIGLRAKRMGKKVVLSSKAIIWHAGSVNIGVDSSEKSYYLARSTMLFFNKNLRGFGKLFFNIKKSGLIFIKMIRVLLGSNAKRNRAFIKGQLDYYLKRFNRRYI